MFETPQEILGDRGAHFCNWVFRPLFYKYEVKYKVSTPYHPPKSSQVDVSNKEIKSILNKTKNIGCTNCAQNLDDALYTYRTTFKTHIRMFPYQLVYENFYDLPVELYQKAL